MKQQTSKNHKVSAHQPCELARHIPRGCDAHDGAQPSPTAAKFVEDLYYELIDAMPASEDLLVPSAIVVLRIVLLNTHMIFYKK